MTIWKLAYRPDPSRPTTMSGRLAAHIARFKSEESAAKYCEDNGLTFLYPITVEENAQPVEVQA